MKITPTFTATIYIGMREQYTETIRSVEMAREYLHDYVNEVGLCVTLTPCEFIYTGREKGDGSKTDTGEPGFTVGLINYLRFPSTPADIKTHALKIASDLLKLFKQYKVTIILSDETIMREEEEAHRHPAGSSLCPRSPCTRCEN